MFAEIANSLHQSGQTVQGFLGELYRTYGYFQVKHIVPTTSLNPEHPQTNNGYLVCNDPAVVQRIFSRLRNYDGMVSWSALVS